MTTRVQFDTGDTYTKGVFDYDVSLTGDWPNIKFHYTYEYRIRITGTSGAWYINNCRAWFHTGGQYFNLSLNLPSGGYSGVVASGSTDIAWSDFSNTRTCTLEPGTGIETSLWSGGTKVKDTLTIDYPTVYQANSASNITQTSATINWTMTNNRKFWRAQLYDRKSKKTWTPSTVEGNGSSSLNYTITGLSPATEYEITVQVLDRKGEACLTGGVYTTFKTIANTATTPTLSASSVAMRDGTVTINLPRADTAFTHKVTYTFGNSGEQTISSSAATSCVWTPPISLASQIPNATSGTATIKVYTMWGSTQIGSTQSKTLTLTVPSNIVPSISTSVSASPSYSGITKYVAGKNAVVVTPSGAGTYGSSISSTTTTFENKSYTHSSATSAITTSTVSGSGSLNVVTTVKDSRGRTASKTQTITSMAYSAPKVTSFTAYRADSTGAAATAGTYVTWSATTSYTNDGGNSETIVAQFSKDNSTWTTVASTKSGTYNINLSPGSVGYFRVGVSDKITTTPSYSSIITLPITAGTKPVLSKTSAAIGADTITISLPANSSTFTHSISYSFGSIENSFLQSNATGSVDWLPPVALANEIPNATSGTCTITVVTKEGDVVIGTENVVCTLTIPSSAVPTIETSVSSSKAFAGITKYVQGKQPLVVKPTASAVYGATIKSVVTTFENKTYQHLNSSAAVNTDNISGHGDLTVTTKVTDSRGRTASVSKTVSVMAYKDPSVTSLLVDRCLEDGTKSVNGTYIWYSFTTKFSNDGGNEETYQVQYCPEGSSSWKTVSTSLKEGVYAAALSTESKGYIKVGIKDKITTTYSYVTTIISEAFDLINFHKDGRGLAFGQRGQAGRFDSTLPMYVNGYPLRFRKTYGTWSENPTNYVYYGQIIATDVNEQRSMVLEQYKRGTASKMYLLQYKYPTSSSGTFGIFLCDRNGTFSIEPNATFKAPAIYQNGKLVADTSNYAQIIPEATTTTPGLMSAEDYNNLWWVSRTLDAIESGTTTAVVVS